jgi:hypothetical protein
MVVGAPDVTMTLDDYGFTLSRPLARGRHVVRVRNVAAQPHEVFVARLAPARRRRTRSRGREDAGSAAAPAAGRAWSGLATGMANDIALDLAPGEYAFFCFLPDAKDGKPHVAHGMVRQFTVR